MSQQFSLIKHLQRTIQASGPVSVSRYMQECLSNPVSGYYVRRSPFEGKGDFTTAPEQGQLFGEMLGAWTVAEWKRLQPYLSPEARASSEAAAGPPTRRRLRLVEIGAGSGALMSDIINSVFQLQRDLKEIEVVLVDAGEVLRKHQEATLEKSVHREKIRPSWFRHIDEIPEFDGYSFMYANEYLDAMPTHQFQKTPEGWRERMIDVDSSSPSGFRFVLSPSYSAVTKMFEDLPFTKNAKEGDIGEVSFEAMEHARRMVRVLRSSSLGGTALVVDYGEHTRFEDTFRAYKDHQQVDVLSHIGECDLTADVNFDHLIYALAKYERVMSAGPMTQREFLTGCGIMQRAQALINAGQTKQERLGIAKQLDMLVSDEKMGTRFKVLAVPVVVCGSAENVADEQSAPSSSRRTQKQQQQQEEEQQQQQEAVQFARGLPVLFQS